MRRLMMLASLAIAIGILLPASGTSAAGGGNLPFWGSLSGAGTLNLATGQLHADVAGLVTYGGRRVTFTEDVQVVPTKSGFDWFGTWTMAATNGDRIVGTSIGTGEFTDAIHSSWAIDFVSTAGSGRFANVKLTFHSDAVATTTSVTPPILVATVDAPLIGHMSLG